MLGVEKDKQASLLDTRSCKSLFSSRIYLAIFQNHVIRNPWYSKIAHNKKHILMQKKDTK